MTTLILEGSRSRMDSRNPAASSKWGAAVREHARRHGGYPTPFRRRTLGRVAGPAEHGAVGDVEGCATCCERHDVINGQVTRRVGVALIARAPAALLTTPGAEHAGAEALPGPRAVQGVVPAAVGLAGVVGTATARAAGDDTTDRAQLHLPIVGGAAGAVYPLAVLRPGAIRRGPEPVAVTAGIAVTLRDRRPEQARCPLPQRRGGTCPPS